MSKVEERAHKHARRDAEIFWDNHNWSDILQRYAYVVNKAGDELEKLSKMIDRGRATDEDDWEDYHYYNRYRYLFACWIADEILKDRGYEKDKKGKWSL